MVFMIPAEIKKSLIYVLETTYCSNVFMDGLYLTKKKVTSQQPRGKGVQGFSKKVISWSPAMASRGE
jgi:hypothetical protein